MQVSHSLPVGRIWSALDSMAWSCLHCRDQRIDAQRAQSMSGVTNDQVHSNPKAIDNGVTERLFLGASSLLPHPFRYR
jgi:hypothetical protein